MLTLRFAADVAEALKDPKGATAARNGDHTMMHPLVPSVEHLAAASGKENVTAPDQAVPTAEGGSDATCNANGKFGRGSYVFSE